MVIFLLLLLVWQGREGRGCRECAGRVPRPHSARSAAHLSSTQPPPQWGFGVQKLLSPLISFTAYLFFNTSSPHCSFSKFFFFIFHLYCIYSLSPNVNLSKKKNSHIFEHQSHLFRYTFILIISEPFRLWTFFKPYLYLSIFYIYQK